MNNLVMINNDKNLRTNSKIVADHFGKEHRTIHRKIKDLIKSQPEFGNANFGVTSYTTEQNKVHECYEMSRDGFAMIAMSLTGKEAEQWKIKFITAFNQMEQVLTQFNSLALSDRVNEAETKYQIQQIEQKALESRIQSRLNIAKMLNHSFDINEFLSNDKSNLPTHVLLDLKMAMGEEIATYGTLDLERHSLGHLLEKYGVDMTAKKFNEEYLIPEGLLSTDRKITAKGKYFGTNDIANSRTGETCPRWFDVRFKELLDYLNI